MSYWIEIHCDVDDEDRAPRAYLPAPSYGETGCAYWFADYPGILTDTPRGAIKVLGEIAKESGWRRRAKGWVCQSCAKLGKKPS